MNSAKSNATGKGAEDGVVTGPSSILPHSQRVGFGEVDDNKTVAEAAEGSAEEFKAAVDRTFAPSVPEGQLGHGAIMERSPAEHDRMTKIVEDNKKDFVRANEQRVKAHREDAENEEEEEENDEKNKDLSLADKNTRKLNRETAEGSSTVPVVD